MQDSRSITCNASAGVNTVQRWNPAFAVLALALAAVLYGLPFLTTAPNRLVSGQPLYLAALLQGSAWLPALLLVALVSLSLLRPVRGFFWAELAAASLLMPGFLWLAADQASRIAPGQSPIARTSPGAAFWLAVIFAALMAADALQRLGAGWRVRLVVAAAVALSTGLLLWGGWCNDLSIMKEYANRSEGFLQAVMRHAQIVGLAIAITLCIGLPLGWAAFRFGRVRGPLFPVLNLVQTSPSIALFGLLTAPLAFLAAAWPALGKAGISGVGLTPGVIALVLYSLLPVVRGMLIGLEQVPSSATQAAAGLGMQASQIFWQIQLPLSLPVVLSGVRTAAVQAVGLAAVTALIGAGGLGAIMFEGLFANAPDLVLLGVLPVVLMGVLVDVFFQGLISLSSRSSTEVLSET